MTEAEPKPRNLHIHSINNDSPGKQGVFNWQNAAVPEDQGLKQGIPANIRDLFQMKLAGNVRSAVIRHRMAQ